MCLGIPGKIKKVFQIDNIKMGIVDYSGVEVEVCLEATPEVSVDDYVIVHAGFSISRLGEQEANETLQLLHSIEEANKEENTG